VTHPDGSQSIQEVTNDMGMRRSDKRAIMARVRYISYIQASSQKNQYQDHMYSMLYVLLLVALAVLYRCNVFNQRNKVCTHYIEMLAALCTAPPRSATAV
jgi:hypothetical protein